MHGWKPFAIARFGGGLVFWVKMCYIILYE